MLFQYYGPAIFSNMESVGFTVTLLLYIIVYIALGNLFRAFKIADYSILETVFSQLLAFGIADLLLYGEFCMIRHNYVNLVPGLMTVGCQLLAALLWGLLAKRMTMLFFQSRRKRSSSPAPPIRASSSGSCASSNTSFGWRRSFRTIRCGPTGKCSSTRMTRSSSTRSGSSSRRSEMLWYCMQSRKKPVYHAAARRDHDAGLRRAPPIDTPLMKIEYHSERFWYNLFKRISDIVVSLLALIVTSPIFSPFRRRSARGPRPRVLSQKRCTKNGARVFEISSAAWSSTPSETERDPVPHPGDRASRARRRIIRKLRIDELPQILNVLKGDMALRRPRGPTRRVSTWRPTRRRSGICLPAACEGRPDRLRADLRQVQHRPYDKLRLDLQYTSKSSL